MKRACIAYLFIYTKKTFSFAFGAGGKTFQLKYGN